MQNKNSFSPDRDLYMISNTLLIDLYVLMCVHKRIHHVLKLRGITPYQIVKCTFMKLGKVTSYIC